MFKIKNMMFVGLLLFAAAVPISCGAVDWVNEQEMVFTTLDQVDKAKRGDIIVLPTEKIPEKYRESWKDEVVVLAPEDSLIPTATYVPVSTESEDWGPNALVSAAQGLLRFGSTFIPQLAGLEALLLLLFRRKRKHYKNALKSLAPTGEGINVMEGVKSIGKALGMTHSSEGTEEVFDLEEEEEE
jgi:hypothetical protein|tara:strand:- start:2799 stop:3353 length:555 start_codon:yes stop_codon:yes gene_type:complete